MTIAGIKAIEGVDEGGAPAAASEDAPAEAAPAAGAGESKAAPLIQPSKIVDITRDLPTSLPVKTRYVKAVFDSTSSQDSDDTRTDSTLSVTPPATPEREFSDKEVSTQITLTCWYCQHRQDRLSLNS